MSRVCVGSKSNLLVEDVTTDGEGEQEEEEEEEGEGDGEEGEGEGEMKLSANSALEIRSVCPAQGIVEH